MIRSDVVADLVASIKITLADYGPSTYEDMVDFFKGSGEPFTLGEMDAALDTLFRAGAIEHDQDSNLYTLVTET